MIEAKSNYKVKKTIDSDLVVNFANAVKNPKFKNLITNLKINDDIAKKYTSKLEDTVAELENCEKCKGLYECKNSVEGYANLPKVTNRLVDFSLVACKYKKRDAEAKKAKLNNKKYADANFKEIDITDSKRAKVIKNLKEFYDNYSKNKGVKGLFLHGNFGCGKTYLIAALLNELAKKRVRTHLEYFPELIRELKSDFDTYADKMEYLMNMEVLLIDDIGAEKVTEWSRDEVLGTILQYRMDNHLATFFTSNLNINELESHLSSGTGSDNAVKARRIIERIKHLTVDMEMISENRRV